MQTESMMGFLAFQSIGSFLELRLGTRSIRNFLSKIGYLVFLFVIVSRKAMA